MGNWESTSYLTPFRPDSRPVFWFNETFPANAWSRRHSHSWGELVYVARGNIVVCTSAGNWLAPPHRAVWIPSGLEHNWYLPCDSRDCSLWIDQRVLMSVERFKRCHMMEVSPLMREILLYISPRPCGDSDGPLGRLVLALLDQLLEQPEITDPLAMPGDRRLVELCTALVTAPGEDIPLNEWATRLGMSERNLGRVFRRETGASFRDWRKTQRMQAALGRLRQGESVTSVAIDCGYASVSAFICAFRQTYGQTPGKIRDGVSAR